MPKYVLTTANTIGPFSFPMTRAEVRTILATTFNSCKRGGGAHEADVFPAFGLMAYFQGADELLGVEIDGDYIEVLFDGVNLFSLTLEQANQFFETRGFNPNLNVDGLVIKELSIGLWFPEPDDGEPQLCKSIAVEQPGRYA